MVSPRNRGTCGRGNCPVHLCFQEASQNRTRKSLCNAGRHAFIIAPMYFLKTGTQGNLTSQWQHQYWDHSTPAGFAAPWLRTTTTAFEIYGYQATAFSQCPPVIPSWIPGTSNHLHPSEKGHFVLTIAPPSIMHNP